MQLRHEMSRFGVVLFMVALGACQAVENHGPAEPALHAKRITADDLAGVAAGSRLVLQTPAQDDVILFDPTKGPLDFSKVELTCPNGRQMAMDTWLAGLSTRHGVNTAEMTADVFSLALAEHTAADGLDVPAPTGRSRKSSLVEGCVRSCVEQSCYLCTDGQWVCTCARWEYICDGDLP